MVENVIIMGAAGRDFHNFNVYFRENKRYHVVCFTATQIPNIDGRRYPPELSGNMYPDGIPIHSDEKLADLIREHGVDLVAFSYSDVRHAEVMHKASVVTAAGADFIIIGAAYTMLRSEKKVVSVCAVRTGCGKSQTSREVVRVLQEMGKKVVSVRHPMPYGDLTQQVVQRFATYADLDRYHCTIEEREEYEPVVDMGAVIYAGVDYEKILREAEKEADVIVWDGGNNDTPFYKPDVNIVVFDPHRAGHETAYHPGETNMLMADIAIISKVDSAEAEKVTQVRQTIEQHNPDAAIILADSAVLCGQEDAIRGRRVLVVEDGPTLTHGEMAYGAGVIAARRFGASEMVDPRPWLAGTLKETFAAWPHIGPLLPAMGYSARQVSDLAATINATECDLVLAATPTNLTRLITVNKPVLRVRYEYRDNSRPTLAEMLRARLGE
ncbi:GTPase [Desulfonema ishimotonii]|uniref:GTPase n=1 Tax=Desulfonema ishimotonii TaxID=45657 RepID=A0A401G4Q9_9BACT|nr:cyclic 2,3-diphosphoglycerate synthase [Desulfonema ishimotonii]GBC64135.1 GTPase [Desulfonema ishimotonii]